MSLIGVRQAIVGTVNSWAEACLKVDDDGIVEVSRMRVESLKRALLDAVDTPYFLEDETEEADHLRRGARR